MKVLLPFLPLNRNIFFDDLLPFTEWEWMFRGLDETVDDYDVVSIHWPEALLDWREPTQEDLDKLARRIKEWKSRAPIVYTRHDSFVHRNGSSAHRKLFDLIIENADCIVHLGEYSIADTLASHPSTEQLRHEVIPHHLYTGYPNNVSGASARKTFHIAQRKKVVLVFGNLRHATEKQFVFSAFSKVVAAGKLLLSPRLLFPIPDSWRVIRGEKARKRMGKLINFVLSLTGSFRLKNRFVKDQEVQNYLAASDVLFVPRADTLNSGLPLLGLAFDVPVVGPRCGNIEEVIRESGGYLYDAGDSGSAAQAIEQALCDGVRKDQAESYKKKVHPSRIAAQYEALFSRLVAER